MTEARYRILRRLGQGGMAEVFEAELAGELGFSRKVAIKRMLADAATELASARRFIDEAQIASRLHHANIVSVIDVGLLDGLPFQVLELVDGINAQQLMSRAGGKLPIDIALIIAGDVAHALDHAHTAHDPDGLPLGIVHRDVKPANVLLSWSGDVKLGDFGIAVARDRSAHTETGVVAGTSGFIAPEQRARSEIDGRTDVFALGLTLHALVAGYSPLRDVTVEMAVMAGGTVPLDPSLPPDIARLIARAVAPARLDRFTAGAFAEAIGGVLAPRMLRDVRGHLREFLASFHENARAKAGALDQLLGLDVVPEPNAAPDAPPQFMLRPTNVVTAIARPRPRGRGRAVAIAITVGLVAGGGAALTWRFTRTPAIVVADARVAADASPDATPDAPPDALPDAVVVDAAVDAATHVVHEHRDAGHTMPGDATAPAGTGWLQIVGEDVIGATVVVDGQPLGHVPNPIEVSAGHHRIQLRRLDGTPVQGTRDRDHRGKHPGASAASSLVSRKPRAAHLGDASHGDHVQLADHSRPEGWHVLWTTGALFHPPLEPAMSTTGTDLQLIAPEALETVSGGALHDDQMTSLLTQITSSLKSLGYNQGNTSTSDMMMLMMVMMGTSGGGGGGGFGFGGGGGFFSARVGGWGGGPAFPEGGGCCPPCKGW